jgi:hypothetical protein
VDRNHDQIKVGDVLNFQDGQPREITHVEELSGEKKGVQLQCSDGNSCEVYEGEAVEVVAEDFQHIEELEESEEAVVHFDVEQYAKESAFS